MEELGLRSQDVVAGRHACLIHASEVEKRERLSDFIGEGLRNGERIVYVTHDGGTARFLDWVRSLGFPADEMVARQQLVVKAASETYMRDGAFDPQRTVDMVATEIELGRQLGFPQTRITGEMIWAVDACPAEDILAYESALNTLVRTHPCKLLCQYDRVLFPATTILDILTTHPVALVGADTYRNFYHIPPDQLQNGERAESELSNRLLNLRLHQGRDDALADALETLARRKTQLEDANSALESFSYSISHDLRAPLRVIDGYGRVLADDHVAQLPSEAQACVSAILSTTEQMRRMVDSLLDLSRATSLPLQPAEVDMQALATSCVAELVGADGREVEFLVAALPPASGDKTLLRRVWANLIQNAWKFTSHTEHPRIEIGAIDDHTWYVRDNGAGFDPRTAGKLFTAFRRLHPSAEFPGDGIGLALAHRVIERHGGRIWAESAPREGATFYFTLPA